MFDTSNWELAMSRPPDRLIRFVDDESLAPLVCHFDPVKNLLRVTRAYYNVLSEREQTIVWRSNKNMTFQDIEREVAHRRKQ